LTEPQLKPLLDYYETPHEAYSCQDDFHEAFQEQRSKNVH
jgi:hypothetical protein